MEDPLFSLDELREFTQACFECVSVPKRDATWTAEVLLIADLQGRPSHGLFRLGAYIHGVEYGKINPAPAISRVRTAIATVVMDGDNGLGPVVASAAMRAAVECAKEAGVGVATVKRANHAGALGIYTAMAAEEGFIGIAFSNAQPAIPPWGGRQAFFGTNPIAMSAGRGTDQITVDLATSIVARGNIILAAKRGERIPEGWALDANGAPTTDAAAALLGAVLPMAGPKGYSLALLVEILAGVLSGSAIGPEVGSIYNDQPEEPNTGMCFIALNPEMFIGQDAFESRLSAMQRAIREVPTAAGAERIYLPGERRRREADDRRRNGVPLSADTIEEMHELARRFGLEMPRDCHIPLD